MGPGRAVASPPVSSRDNLDACTDHSHDGTHVGRQNHPGESDAKKLLWLQKLDRSFRALLRYEEHIISFANCARPAGRTTHTSLPTLVMR